MRVSYNSPVILTFSLICTGVLFIDNSTGEKLIKSLFVAYPGMEFNDPFTYLRLISHAIGHKNWAHLIGNFTLILLIGPVLEEKHGSQKMLIMMIISAGITGLLNTLFFPTGLLGASGIVFMFIILGSFTNIKSGEVPLTFLLVILLFLTKEVLDAFQHDNISQFAHIMGGICGSVFGFKSAKS
jgi:membrane associated rhomboid family serine protease